MLKSIPPRSVVPKSNNLMRYIAGDGITLDDMTMADDDDYIDSQGSGSPMCVDRYTVDCTVWRVALNYLLIIFD